MEEHQELEWAAAQRIVISEDLVAAAKQQLRFLAAVDRSRWLYGGPELDRAIYRYKNFWLPLLAKHSVSESPEGLLVVPIDCEWIWHCHRLNPIRYRMDCMEQYGRILDSKNVVSSVCGNAKEKTETEELWNKLFPNETYELSLCGELETVAKNEVEASKNTSYDIVSAVKRQSPFYYQVSRPSMNDDLYLEGAVARYKGFLHLIRKNKEKNTKCFCVPTYDIDLIWHSHQLHPVSYCKDVVAVLGKVLEHDDTDSDRSEGKKLDVGFCETTKQWEDTFGLTYWRAGAMNRGAPPSPLSTNFKPSDLNNLSKKVVLDGEDQGLIQLPKKQLVEVLLEIVGARNLPDDHHADTLFLSFTKKQPDLFFKSSKKLSILSNPSEKKQVSAFQCEPTGELLLELVANSTKILGTTLISLEEFLNPVSELSMDSWFELVPTSGNEGSKPISLRLSLSFSTPVQAPYVLHMVQPHSLSRNSFFPLPERVYHAKSWAHVVDDLGHEVISIQMRVTEKSQGGIGTNGISKTEVIGMTKSGETCVLAEFFGHEWSLMSSQWFFQLQKKVNTDQELNHIGMLTGSRTMVIFQGRKLDYEIKSSERLKHEGDFITIVEFSAESPCGKAVALLNLKSGFLRIEEEWLVLPGIALAFVLSGSSNKEGCGSFLNIKREHYSKGTDAGFGGHTKSFTCGESGGCGYGSVVEAHGFIGWTSAGACGGCGAGCGGGCGGSCGGGCRGGCGGGCRSDGDSH